MASNATCNCGEKHTGHLCVLKSLGLIKEVEHLTSNPIVACFTCGSEANSADNVCSPVSLEK